MPLFLVTFSRKHGEISGTPASRPLFVPPAVPGTPGRSGAVESSIAAEDAGENRGLYRVFVSRLF